MPTASHAAPVPGLTLWTLEERPDLTPELLALAPRAWPLFILADDVSLRAYDALFALPFTAFQFVFCEHETVIAAGQAIPLVWDGTLEGLPQGWDGALLQGIADQQAGRVPSALSALAATIDPAYQGRGLSHLIIRTMKALAAEHGLRDLIAPVRPSLKARYPLISIEQYMSWRRADGSPFDPWLRTHWRVGAEFLRAEPASMQVTGTVADWEAWTEMRFPESGTYVVPGALVPVTIDCAQDQGRYVEPNIWMRHRIAASAEETRLARQC
jgi:GNAT superfamily N-acetyltransferase